MAGSEGPAVLLEGVSVTLGGVRVLRGVSLRVDPGEAVALIGRNAAGKTTTLKTIMGVYRPEEGRITVLGRDTAGLKPYEIARMGVGYVPQERTLFPGLSVTDNLEIVYGGPIPRDVMDRLTSIFPELKRILEREAAYLSGGERVIVSIARALLFKPRLLLLDEPFEGLAPRVIESLTKALRRLKEEERIALLVTESGLVTRLEGLVDRAYGIDRGEIVHEGPLRDFLENEEVRRKVWGF